jgi:hypothetical protein
LIQGIIRVAKLFIDPLEPLINNKLDVIDFKQALEEAGDIHNQYLI